MLRHSINKFPRKLGKTWKGNEDGSGLGHEGHLKRLKQIVGDLFRYERIESSFNRCDEARGYAERVILYNVAVYNSMGYIVIYACLKHGLHIC